jgi:Stage II sporulation protein E (SpoIIE)/CHASE2 domain
VERERFEGRLVLLGVTAVGLGDRSAIPGGGTRAGVEIHAELIESIFDNALLVRPRWASWAEAAIVAIGGALFILRVPVRRARALPLVLLPLVALSTGGSLALYHWQFLLLDAATPSLALIVLFAVMLSATLAEAERQRRLLRRQVEQQREAAARIEGELSAARRIQLGILPKPADVLAGETRVTLDAVLETAREVGGDLYDFFMLDRDHLFFLLGDVSGKGLPGSLFMAVSKSLYKSTALRRGGAVATMMQEANTEISRDNREALFVTVFAAVLDLETGVLEYCNAGHDQPYLVTSGGGVPGRLAEGGGPPLCVLDDFAYTAATPAATRRYPVPRHRRGDGSAERGGRVLRPGAPDAPVGGDRRQRQHGDRGRHSARRGPAIHGRQRARGRPRDPDPALAGAARAQRTVMSTRRLRGSSTSSSVGTSGARSPRPAAWICPAGTPTCTRSSRTRSARRSDSASL